MEHHHTGLPHTILSVSKGQVFVVKADLMRSLEKNLLIVRGGHVFDVQTGGYLGLSIAALHYHIFIS